MIETVQMILLENTKGKQSQLMILWQQYRWASLKTILFLDLSFNAIYFLSEVAGCIYDCVDILILNHMNRN